MVRSTYNKATSSAPGHCDSSGRARPPLAMLALGLLLCLLGVGASAAAPAKQTTDVLTTRLTTQSAQNVFGRIDAARRLLPTNPAAGLAQADAIVRELEQAGLSEDGMMAHALNARAGLRLQLVMPDPAQRELAVADIERGVAIAQGNGNADMRWAHTSLLLKKTEAIAQQPIEYPQIYAQAKPVYEAALAASEPGDIMRWTVLLNFSNSACVAFDLETCRTQLSTLTSQTSIAALDPGQQFNYYKLNAWIGAYGGDWELAADALSDAARLLGRCDGRLESTVLLGIHQLTLVLMQTGASALAQNFVDVLDRCLRATNTSPTNPDTTLVAATAQTWASIADIRMAFDNPEGAAPALEEATRYMNGLLSRARSHPIVFSVFLVYRRVGAELAVHAGNPRQAITFLEGVVPGSCAYDVALLARLYAETGQADRARAMLDDGFAKLGRETLCEYNDWRFYIEAARVLATLGDLTGAISLGKEAIVLSEQTRRGFDAERQRTFVSQLVASRAGIYRDTAAWLITGGRSDEAQLVLGLLRNREVEELSRGVIEGLALAVEAFFRPDELRARERLSRGGAKALTESLALLDRTEKASAPAAQLDMRALRPIAPGDVEVSVVPSGDKVVFDVRDSSGSLDCSRVSVTAAGLATEALMLGFDLSQPPTRDESWQARSQWLYRHAWQPIEGCVAKRLAKQGTVYLNLQGVLRAVPFGALHDGQKYLVQRYTFTTVTDGTELRQFTPRGQLGLASFGANSMIGSREQLKFATDEARTVAEAYGETSRSRVFVDRNFTRSAFLDALEDNSVARVHVATHFVLPTAGLPSGHLVLGDGSKLFAAELAHRRFEGLNLMVLSACDTVREVRSNDRSLTELDSLGAMLQRQGVAAVVGSLWRVNDAAAPHLMKQFYQTLRSTASTTAPHALRTAQLSLLDSTDTRLHHPHYWAPFIVIGRPAR